MNPDVALIADAARRRDAAALVGGVDWPASGVSAFIRALWQIEPVDRSRLAAVGVENLLAEGSTIPMPIGSLASLLSGAVQVRQADATETEVVQAALRPPGLPPEVTGLLAARISDVVKRVDELTEIWVLASDDGSIVGIATGPMLNGVAVLRHLEDI